ncbi:Putative gluconeogenesis factor (fragment) [Candidatus Sulfopaludibacter sp. SbA3]
MEGIPAAMRKSPAIKAYFVNLMSQPGETSHFTASDHIRAIHRHASGKFLDYAVVNIRAIPSTVKKRYAREDAMPVENDIDAVFKMGLKVMAGNLAKHGEKVRHDSDSSAALVMKLAQEGRRRRNSQR